MLRALTLIHTVSLSCSLTCLSLSFYLFLYRSQSDHTKFANTQQNLIRRKKIVYFKSKSAFFSMSNGFDYWKSNIACGKWTQSENESNTRYFYFDFCRTICKQQALQLVRDRMI